MQYFLHFAARAIALRLLQPAISAVLRCFILFSYINQRYSVVYAFNMRFQIISSATVRKYRCDEVSPCPCA